VKRYTIPQSPLVEFAHPVRREVAIDPLGTYRTVGCHLYGKGVYERETKTGVEIKASRMWAIDKDDLVINRIWAQKGSAGIVPNHLASAVVTQDFPVWVLDSNKAFPPYIGWYLKTPSFWEECRRHSHGTSGRERLSPRELPNVMFPLPPLDEQRRIVARIEELAALIGEAKELRAKAREEADTLLASTMRRVFDVSEEPPDHWRWATISDVGDKERDTVQTGPFGAQLSSSEFTHEGVPVLAIGNVQWGYLDTEDLKHVSEAKADQLSRYRVKAGDILFARMGTVGRSCVVPEFAENWLISYHLIRIAVDRSVCNPQFVFYALRGSPSVLETIEEKTRGSTRAGVNSTILRQLKFPFPPLDEQRRIVTYLDDLQAQVDGLAALQDATQAELNALLPSVLHRAFRGEL